MIEAGAADVPEPMEAFLTLHGWLEAAHWRSHDVCDVRAHPLFLGARSAARRGAIAQALTAPLNHLERQRKPLIRRLLRIQPQEFPQAYAVGARGLFAAFRATQDNRWAVAGVQALDKLPVLASKAFSVPCWGQPYDWPAKQTIPADTPRTTVTSIAVMAILDAYDALGDNRWLNWAHEATRYYTEVVGQHEAHDGTVCFAYTSVDDFRVHNANVVGAAALYRAAVVIKDSDAMALALRAFQFTVNEQNADGSWFYWSPQTPATAIDHYHTGFVLEALSDLKVAMKDRFPFDAALARGVAFYQEHLFDPDGAPRMTPKNRDPVDIQSCAQAIITWTALARNAANSSEQHTRTATARQTWRWTATHMRDPSGFFYYRRTAHSVDRSAYVRWGQSWMLRALGSLLEKKSMEAVAP